MVRAGQLWGTQIYISLWTLALLVVCFLFGLFEEVLVWLCALMAHELGHLILAAALGYTFPRLMIRPYGGVMESHDALSLDVMAYATVALAGPLANFLLLGLCLATSRWMNHAGRMLPLMVDVNLALAMVNILPAVPLDGGQALKGYLAANGGHRRAALITTRITRRFSFLCGAVFLVALACGVLWPWPALLAALLWQHARGQRTGGNGQGMRQLLRRRRLMNRRAVHEVKHIAVGDRCTVNEATALLGSNRYYHLDIIDASGKVLGSLSEGRLMEAFFAGQGNRPLGTLLASV